MAAELHVGDVGTRIIITIKDGSSIVDIADATVKRFTFLRKDKTGFIRTPAFLTDGHDGKLVYTTKEYPVDGPSPSASPSEGASPSPSAEPPEAHPVRYDLDSAGKWTLQAYVKLPAGNWHSSTVQFEVKANLEATE